MTRNFDELYNLADNLAVVANLETIIYAFAGKFSDNLYAYGNWESIEYKDGLWFFQLNGDKTWNINNPQYQTVHSVDTKTFSLLCTVFALEYLINRLSEDEKEEKLAKELLRLYYGIKQNYDEILDEEQARMFWKITD